MSTSQSMRASGYLLILLIATYATAVTGCDWWHDWDLELHDGRCLWITQEEFSWLEGVKTCAGIDGRMLHVTSEKNTEQLQEVAASKRPDMDGYWLAVNDLVTEDVFRDFDGAPRWYNWDAGQPDDVMVGGDQQDCMTALKVNSWRWGDDGCTAKKHFVVCEHQPDSSRSRSALFTLLYTGNVHSQFAFETTEVTSRVECLFSCLGRASCSKFYLAQSTESPGLLDCMLVTWDMPGGVITALGSTVDTMAVVYGRSN